MGTELPDGMPAALGATHHARQLCGGSYRAQQIPGAVVVFAEGWHPTSGFRTYFEKSLIAVYPPQFSLMHDAPAGPVLTLLTPFTVWTMFHAKETVSAVVVHDANGTHEIEVEQVLDLKAAKSPSCASEGWIIAQSG